VERLDERGVEDYAARPKRLDADARGVVQESLHRGRAGRDAGCSCLRGPIGAQLVDAADPMYGYAFQIYYDFAGYSDVAIGATRMLGFSLPINFDRPYLVASVLLFSILGDTGAPFIYFQF
jgi:hypothetical protein